MRIIRFYANWSEECKIFSDRKTLDYDLDVDIDLPSYKKTLIKYQISIIPTFIALNNNNRVLGKLSNPKSVEEYLDWKERLKR